MLTMNDLVLGLGVNKSVISRLVKRLKIKPTKKRGKKNQWEYCFSNDQIKKILDYREGIPHNIRHDGKDYFVPFLSLVKNSCGF